IVSQSAPLTYLIDATQFNTLKSRLGFCTAMYPGGCKASPPWMAVKMIDCAKTCMAGKYEAPQSLRAWQSDGGCAATKRGIGAELAVASVDSGAKLMATFAVPGVTPVVAVPTKVGNWADSILVSFASRTS